MKIDSIGIVGGGAWGTALAQAMRQAGRDVVLWAREDGVIAGINDRHVNELFLAGVALDPDIRATGKLADVAACDALLLVVPAQHVRSIAKELRPLLRPGQPVVMCAKGIEQSTGELMGEVLAAELPDAMPAALSGPSFAADVARGLPAALTIACADETVGRALAESLGSPAFRLYWTNDLVGVELGGA
ncbi:MAG: 2-dehydropantoate 2-reductase N-terminal domain-containing protein, partial [Hyphomicrobium sp.]